MKKRSFVLLLMLITGIIFVSGGILRATEGPDEICIENKGYKSDKKGPVKFSHKKHHDDYGVACTECHHDYQNGKNVWKEGDPVKKCSQCHNPKKKQGKVLKLQNAYHKNCKNCHKKLAKAGKETGPYKKCTQCHQKKKK